MDLMFCFCCGEKGIRLKGRSWIPKITPGGKEIKMLKSKRKLFFLLKYFLAVCEGFFLKIIKNEMRRLRGLNFEIMLVNYDHTGKIQTEPKDVRSGFERL